MSYVEMITKQSPWLLDPDQIQTDVHLSRLSTFPLIHHEINFLNYTFKDGVYIVTGPRQIGKSTHIKMLIKKLINHSTNEHFLYFNCDLLDKKQDIVDVVEEYLTRFSTTQRRYICLDEITSVKDSFLAIKYLIDSGHDKNITYILTGSNTISIKKTGEYLPGRRGKGIDFIFRPINFKTFISLQYPKINLNFDLNTDEKTFIALTQQIPLKKLLDTFLMTGGFPRVINEYYLKNYVPDDIFSIYRAWITSEIAKADKKEYIAKCILERSLISLGSDVSYNAFAQDTGIGSHNTVYDYLDFFVNAFVLLQIHHYDINQKKVNYRKNKKIYFNDPFIYAVINAWLTGKPRQDYNYLKEPKTRSNVIENVIYSKLNNELSDVYFYKSSFEIDFVSGDYLIEVKYQNKIIPDDYKNLIRYNNKNVLVSKNTYKKTNDVLLIPIEYFLLCDL